MKHRPTPLIHGLIMTAIRCTSRATGVAVDDILGKRGTRDTSDARFMAMYLARKMHDKRPVVTSQIGWVLNRDHTAVVYGSQQAAILRQQDKHFNQLLEQAAMYVQEELTNQNIINTNEN